MENHQYAGFWIRLGAMLIDAVLIMIVFLAPLTAIYGQEYWQSEQIIHGFWDLMFSYVFPFVVTIWFWLRFFGTPGKMILKLRLVDAKTGGRLSLGQAIGRYFAYIVSAIPLLLGYFWIAFDRRKQGFHDKLAGTVVLREGAGEPPGEE